MGSSPRLQEAFQSDSIFNELDDEDLIEESRPKAEKMATATIASTNGKVDTPAVDFDSDSDSDFEIVPNAADEEEREEDDTDDEQLSNKERVDLTTAEAMTLAHKVALGKMTKKDLIEEESIDIPSVIRKISPSGSLTTKINTLS